jgi:hypothetical protein
MFKQAALNFVGEPAILAEIYAEDAGDVAIGGALARALDASTTRRSRPRRAGAGSPRGTTRQFAGHAEIPIKRNADHGWVLSTLLRYSHSHNATWLVWCL